MDESAHTDTGTSRARRVLCLSVLLIGNISAFCCISLLGPFFPNEAAKKGASMTVVGFIFSCPQLVVFLTSPLFGALLSEVSLRFMCISGLLVFCSSMVLFGLLADSPPGWTFIGLCFATRVVEALGTASYVTSSFTIAVGLFPDRKPLIFALLEAGIGVGYAVGPVVGSFLYEFGGFRMTFWTIGGCVFIVGFAILITLPHVRQETSPVSLRSMFLLLRSPLFSVGGLSLTCVCYVFNVWVPGYAQYLQQFGLRMSTIGLMFLVLPLTYTIISPIFGLVMSTKVPVIPAILTSQLALSVAMLLYGPAPFLTFLPRALWLLILSTVCMGVFNSSLYMGTIACIFTGVRELGMKDDSKTQGLVSGIVRSALSLGEFISPMIGGVLTDSFGFAWATTSDCFMTFLVFIVYLYVRHRNKPSCIPGAEGYIQLDKMESSKRTTFSAADSGSKRLITPGTQ